MNDAAANCTFQSEILMMTCGDGRGPFTLEFLPSQPTDLANYIRASDFLAQNYSSNHSYTSAFRSGGRVVLEPLIVIDPDGDSPILNYVGNPFSMMKLYGACLMEPLSSFSCSAFEGNKDIITFQQSMTQNSYCYY